MFWHIVGALNEWGSVNYGERGEQVTGKRLRG